MKSKQIIPLDLEKSKKTIKKQSKEYHSKSIINIVEKYYEDLVLKKKISAKKKITFRKYTNRSITLSSELDTFTQRRFKQLGLKSKEEYIEILIKQDIEQMSNFDFNILTGVRNGR